MEHLSAEYSNDYIVLVCDGAAWHKSGALKSFPNIEILFIPPYTPEMNSIEQIWKELRARGFHNEVFQTLEKVVDRLCDTICNLASNTLFTELLVATGLLDVLIREYYKTLKDTGQIPISVCFVPPLPTIRLQSKAGRFLFLDETWNIAITSAN